MKKICLFFILFFIPLIVYAEDLNLAENAKSAILIEASTGEILYSKNKTTNILANSISLRKKAFPQVYSTKSYYIALRDVIIFRL